MLVWCVLPSCTSYVQIVKKKKIGYFWNRSCASEDERRQQGNDEKQFSGKLKNNEITRNNLSRDEEGD